MTTAGWIIMIVSVGSVVGMLVFCFYRVLSAPSSTEQTHAPPDNDTHDRET